jgi:tungsten cofactor oxidoreducase radical SAM maturase
MTEIRPNINGEILIPGGFFERRRLDPLTTFWLDEREGDLILYPRQPDARKLYIEVTTACNLSCQTCIRNSWSDPSADMDDATFERILESIKKLPNLERVIFTSFGEPLVNPKLFSMIEAVRRLGLDVTLGTNGVLLSDQLSRQLIRLGVDQLVVSIDGGKPETYEGVRGTHLSLIIKNLETFNRVKNELGVVKPTLAVEFVAMRSNLDELREVLNLASELNAARLIVSNVLPYTKDMNEEKLYGYGPRKPLFTGSWPVKSDAWIRWGVIETPKMFWGAERRCRFVQDKSLVVSWDGSVTPCYAYSHSYQYYAIDGVLKNVERYSLGNVNEQLLDEIWMSEEFTRFRSNVRAFHFPSCPDCDLRETCDLRQNNKACWGPNPSCADCLWAQEIVRCP